MCRLTVRSGISDSDLLQPQGHSSESSSESIDKFKALIFGKCRQRVFKLSTITMPRDSTAALEDIGTEEPEAILKARKQRV